MDAYKKGYIDFCRQTSPLFKTAVSSHKWFFPIFSKNTAFFEKLDEKGYINFLPKKPPFPKKWSNAPTEQFFAVSSENTAFSEKLI